MLGRVLEVGLHQDSFCIMLLSLGREDPLETYSSICVWRIPRTEEPGGLQSTGSQRIGHD